MGHRLNGRDLSVAIAAAAILAAGCSAGGSASPTTSDRAEVRTDAVRLEVTDVEVPVGESRPVGLGEPIVVLGKKAKGLLQVGGLEFRLLEGTDMRLVSWDGPAVGAYVESGHTRVKLDDQARLRLETSSKGVLTAQPGSEFTLCQTPQDKKPKPQTCLYVASGEVEWEAKGEKRTLHAGDIAFAEGDDPPSEVKCLAADVYDAWFQDALSNGITTPLGGLVAKALPCGVTGAPTTASSTPTSATTVATVPTTPPTTQPSTTRPRPKPTTTTMATTTQPTTTQPTTTEPTTTQATTTEPTTTQATTTQPTTTQPTTTQATTTQPTTTQATATSVVNVAGS